MSRFPVLLAAAALAAGCSSPGPEIRARTLRDLHDGKTFRHVPNVEETRARCIEEIRALAAATYGSWPDVCVATYVLARVATEDPTVVGRNEAVLALAPLGAMLAGAAEPPESSGPPDVLATLKRLAELHAGEKGLHAGPEEAAECASLVEALGTLALPVPADPDRGLLRERREGLREILVRLLGIERSPESHEDPAARNGIDRTAIRLASQAARTSLAEAVLFDGDERVRYSAAGVLGALPGDETARILVRAYRDERNASARRVIVQGLGRRAAAGPGPERDAAFPVLLVALDDDDRNVRFHSREALKALAGEDLGDRPDPWKKWWVAQGDR